MCFGGSSKSSSSSSAPASTGIVIDAPTQAALNARKAALTASQQGLVGQQNNFNTLQTTLADQLQSVITAAITASPTDFSTSNPTVALGGSMGLAPGLKALRINRT